MKNIEIPYEKDRSRRYRFFEALPGLLSWSILLLPIILSLISATVAAVFIILYLLIYFARAVGVTTRALQGNSLVLKYKKLNWSQLLEEVAAEEILAPKSERPEWHFENIARLKSRPAVVKPHE